MAGFGFGPTDDNFKRDFILLGMNRELDVLMGMWSESHSPAAIPTVLRPGYVAGGGQECGGRY